MTFFLARSCPALRALASNDERIIEFFRDKGKKEKSNSHSNNELVQFEIDENIIESISEKDLMSSLQLKAWDKLAKLSWMPFEEAREYVRGLNFYSKTFYDEYFRNNERPFDFPSTPQNVYSNSGWKNWGDFLGTNTVATFRRIYLSYDEARNFVHNLKLKNNTEWLDYCKSGKKPENIPAKPMRTYANTGWVSMGDWLGSGVVATDKRIFLSYDKAKKFVRKLGLKNFEEWKIYSNKKEFPDFLPKAPNSVYGKKGEWVSYGDWLGTDRVATNEIKFKSYKDAKKFVHELKLKSNKEWVKFCKIGNLPNDVPKAPAVVYKNKGWVSWGEWLGSDVLATKDIVYISYFQAKLMLIKHNIKTQLEYKLFRKLHEGEYMLPSVPQRTYKSDWKGWADFLGKEEK